MGHQETVEEIRAEKAEKFAELKGKRNDPEYEEWFLRYRPLDKQEEKEKKRNQEKRNQEKVNQEKVNQEKVNQEKDKKTKSNRKKKNKTKKQKQKGFFF
jgi:hypothetical protein